ncbi:UNVERIFIED_CONTAM: hypothetical protein FKN15_057599 [Acipenser sinensis]
MSPLTPEDTLWICSSPGVLIAPISLSQISLSYHFLITANINLPAPSSATDIVISFRPKNLLNPLKLSECVSSSHLTGTLPSSADDAVTLYNTTLTHIIDTVAPLTTRTIKKDCNCPWYTLKLRVLKSACRKTECKWRSSGLMVHREIWTDHLARYRHTLASARVWLLMVSEAEEQLPQPPARIAQQRYKEGPAIRDALLSLFL